MLTTHPARPSEYSFANYFSFADGRWSDQGLPSSTSERTLILAFASSRFADDHAAFRDLHAAFPHAVILGCSSAGEILGQTLRDDTLAVAAAQFRHTDLRFVQAPVPAPAASFDAGHALASQLAHPSLRCVLVLSDGLTTNGTELIRGINSALPRSVVVTGGMAADGDRFKRTWVLHRDAPRAELAVAVGLYGERLRVGCGSRGGWDVFGPERRVTRASGTTLYELDGKPALPLYKRYLGELAQGLPGTALFFPLSLRDGPRETRRVVRTVRSVDEQSQSLSFAGEIREGALAQLMRANSERLLDGAGEAALLASGGSPCLALAISCVGRRLVLGQRTEEELERTLDSLPPRSSQIGFYSYGEFSPCAGGCCELHNQTMTLTTLWEE